MRNQMARKYYSATVTTDKTPKISTKSQTVCRCVGNKSQHLFTELLVKHVLCGERQPTYWLSTISWCISTTTPNCGYAIAAQSLERDGDNVYSRQSIYRHWHACNWFISNWFSLMACETEHTNSEHMNYTTNFYVVIGLTIVPNYRMTNFSFGQ